MKHPWRLLAPRGGRSCRRAGLALAVAVMAVVGLAIAGGAASAQPASPRAPEATRTIRFRVTNATDVELRVSDYSGVNVSWRETPQNTAPITIDDYTAVGTTSLTGSVYYRIGGSAYYLYVYAANPVIGSNSTSCAIQLADRSVPSNAPYTCDRSTGSGNDMNADFVVQPRNAATQTLTPDSGLYGPGLTQRDVVQALCGESPPAFVSCDVASSADVLNQSIVNGSERIVSNILINCSSSSASKTVTTSDTVTETNTIGVTAEVTAALSKTVNAKLAVSYQHSWSHSVMSSESTTVNAAPGEYAYVAEAAAMQNIRANWTVRAGNQTFLVTNVTLLRPSTVEKGLTIVRSFSLPSGFCTGRSGLDYFAAQPLTPAPGGIYTIRVFGTNGRGIAVENALHGPAVRLILAAASNTDPSQQWAFYEVPKYTGYFQVRSNNTLSMCLDLNGIDNTRVMQYPCKAADDPTIANQLWKVVYDPGTGGMQIIDADGYSLATENTSFNIGDPVVGGLNPPANVSRWVLFPA